jgi:hypothetical protein
LLLTTLGGAIDDLLKVIAAVFLHRTQPAGEYLLRPLFAFARATP